MKSKLNKEIINIYQSLADIISNVPREYRCELVKVEVEELKKVILKYSEREVLEFTLSIAGNDIIELQWLARAGVTPTHKFMIDALTGEDGDNVLRAAIALVYLGDPKGEEVLSLFANQKHLLSNEIEPMDELYDILLECDLPKLTKIKKKLEKTTS